MDYSKVVLFSDLDGTLFGDDTCVPENNKAAIRKFCEEGGIFCLSSGRIPANIAEYVEGIPINGPCILGNGSILYDWQSRSFLHRELLNTEPVEGFLKRVLKEFPQVDVQLYPGDEICFVSPEETADREFVRQHQPCRFVTLKTVEKPWMKVLIMGEAKTLSAIRSLGEGILGIGRFVATSSRYLELLPYGVSKGAALRKAMELPGPAGRICVAVGDFYNDIELLQNADVGVAPANALPEVKAAADYIGCSNNDGIIADCIERVIPGL